MDKIYQYETTVQENGVIRIPKMTTLARHRVKVVIRPLEPERTKSLQAAKAFLERWSGILEGRDPDELKSQYMREKYG